MTERWRAEPTRETARKISPLSLTPCSSCILLRCRRRRHYLCHATAKFAPWRDTRNSSVTALENLASPKRRGRRLLSDGARCSDNRELPIRHNRLPWAYSLGVTSSRVQPREPQRIVDFDTFSVNSQETLSFPTAKNPVQRKQAHRSHLREGFLRNLDFHVAVDLAAHLIREIDQLMGQALRSHLSGGDARDPTLNVADATAENVIHVALQHRK